MQLFKEMWDWFFYKPEKGYCGGVECLEIVGRFGKKTDMKIYYNRPTSDQIMSYTYDYQNIIESDNKLRQIGNQKNQFADMAKRLLKIIFVPYSKPIFNRCEGFLDKDGKPVEKKTPEEQFLLIMTRFRNEFGNELVGDL